MTGATRHLLAIALLGAALALPAAQKNSRQIEQELKASAASIERLQRQTAQDASALNQATRDLQEAERSESKARGSLRDLRGQRAERAATRQKLVEQRAAKEAERARHREELANQLRSAYFMGRNESLKLLLNQSNIGEINRTLTYYGYFGRMRASQIANLSQDVANIEELTARIDAEDAELAGLERQQKQRVGELDSAREQRGTALTSLETASRNRSNQLAREKKERQQLEQMLKEILRDTKSAPFDPNAPFARLQGRLAWPVVGRIEQDFGKTAVAGGSPSDGIEIKAQQGAEVRAVHEGSVLFADYFGLRGLVIILDHGNGYISMYAHNEQLFRERGAHVQAGEVIATVGDSGGRPSPGLYFEIRSGVKPSNAGTPMNPHMWFRSKEPPAR